LLQAFDQPDRGFNIGCPIVNAGQKVRMHICAQLSKKILTLNILIFF
jgi:hypothetical protein